MFQKFNKFSDAFLPSSSRNAHEGEKKEMPRQILPGQSLLRSNFKQEGLLKRNQDLKLPSGTSLLKTSGQFGKRSGESKGQSLLRSSLTSGDVARHQQSPKERPLPMNDTNALATKLSKARLTSLVGIFSF